MHDDETMMTAEEVKRLLDIDKWQLSKLKKSEHFPKEIRISHKKRIFRRAEIETYLNNFF